MHAPRIGTALRILCGVVGVGMVVMGLQRPENALCGSRRAAVVVDMIQTDRGLGLRWLDAGCCESGVSSLCF